MFCGWSRGQTFAGLNLTLALFNLLPVGRLDGGRALGCALALLAGPDRAERIGRGLDLLCAGAALGAGLLVPVRRATSPCSWPACGWWDDFPGKLAAFSGQ